MASCGRNCFGITPAEIVSESKTSIQQTVIDFIFNLDKCGNAQTKANAASNLNALFIYTNKRLKDSVEDKVRRGNSFNLSTPSALLRDELKSYIDEFNRLLCLGKGQELVDLDNKYNSGKGNVNGITFPPNMDDSLKDKILDYYDKNNSGLGGSIGSYEDGLNNGIGIGDVNDLDGSDSLGRDALFGEDKTGNPLLNIPDSELDALSLEKTKFTCFDPVFKLDNYVFKEKNENPIITSNRIRNIRKIHNELLLPLFKYYFGRDEVTSCQMKISMGICSIPHGRVMAGSASFSKHLTGEAVDFNLAGIDSLTIVEDIRKGNIKLDFGVLVVANGLHITLPYTFEGYSVRGLIVRSPKKSRNSLKIETIFTT